MSTKVAGTKRRGCDASKTRQVTNVTEHTIRTDSSLNKGFWMEHHVQVIVVITLDVDDRVIDAQTAIKVGGVDGHRPDLDEDCLYAHVAYPWKTQVDGVDVSFSSQRAYTSQNLCDCLNGQREFEGVDIHQRATAAKKILKNIGGPSGCNSAQVASEAITRGCDLLMNLIHHPAPGQEMTQVEKRELMEQFALVACVVTQGYHRPSPWTNVLIRASINFHNFEFLRVFIQREGIGYVPPRNQGWHVCRRIIHMTKTTSTRAVYHGVNIQHVKFVAWLKSKWSVGGKPCPVDPAFLASFLLPSLPGKKFSRVVVLK